MANTFWLGMIGGIAGVLAVVLVVVFGGMAQAFDAMAGSPPYTNAAGGALIFSFVGIAGGVLENRRILGGALMIIAALGALASISLLSALALAGFFAEVTPLEIVISTSLFGVLAFVVFLAAGLHVLTKEKEEAVVEV